MSQKLFILAYAKHEQVGIFINKCHFVFINNGAVLNYAQNEQYWKDDTCDMIRISYNIDSKFPYCKWLGMLKEILSLDPTILFDREDELEIGNYTPLGEAAPWVSFVIPKSCIESN